MTLSGSLLTATDVIRPGARLDEICLSERFTYDGAGQSHHCATFVRTYVRTCNRVCKCMFCCKCNHQIFRGFQLTPRHELIAWSHLVSFRNPVNVRSDRRDCDTSDTCPVHSNRTGTYYPEGSLLVYSQTIPIENIVALSSALHGVDPDTKVGGTAYMSTQREVLEGQTGSHRAKRANFGRGVRGSSPGKFKNLHGKWCNLRYS